MSGTHTREEVICNGYQRTVNRINGHWLREFIGPDWIDYDGKTWGDNSFRLSFSRASEEGSENV